MPWNFWFASSGKDGERKRQPTSWTDSLNATNWSHYTEPQTVIPTVLLTTSILAGVHLYRSYLRRIPEAASVAPHFFRKRSLFGTVTRVGDGDNFHLYHTPGGRLAGWGWLPWRKIPERKGDLKNRTIAVRIAGVDAPEGAHFGNPAQAYSTEALTWLRNYILNRRVRAQIYKRDQYDRIVATVYIRRGLLRRNVGLEMVKAGMATVYDAKSGAEFGDLEARYRKAESRAKLKRIGIWSGKKKDFESPREYKNRISGADKSKQGVVGAVVTSLTSTDSRKS